MHVCRIASERVSVVDAPVIVARDVSYQSGVYRSFEFVSFEVAPGETNVLLSTEHAPARDVLLAVAGLVRPTSGSLVVCGVELAGGASAGRLVALRRVFNPRERLPRAQVGLGVFERVAEVSGAWTVEEAVAREVRLRARRGGAACVGDVTGVTDDVTEHVASRAPGCEVATDAAGKRDAKQNSSSAESRSTDILPFLASLGLATASEQGIDRLNPAQRARLSAALALAGAPSIAVIDLTDPFVAGLAVDDVRALVADVQARGERQGSATLIAMSDPACAHAAEELGRPVTALDISASEALDAARSDDLLAWPVCMDASRAVDATPDFPLSQREVMA